MIKQVFVILIGFRVFAVLECLQLVFGDCPVYYEEPCKPDLVKFILFTGKGNITNFHQLNPFNLHLPKEFNAVVPTKILIHGYGGLTIDKAITSIQKAYQVLGYNVILVDWGALSEIPCYATAYLNTWHVGQCIAILAVSLIPLGIDPSFLHLLGFSLGAHIAGFAGANMKKILKVLPGRITGLDPALPFFATLNNEWKLDSSDAKFVDVVHTSAGTFGKIEAVAHADFYMNGGILQPACYEAPYPPLCSHVMAGIYFAESINSDKNFIGLQCDNLANYVLGLCSNRAKAVMGEYINKR
ncbi:lipase member I-like [Asbolus verrucosus]|uniref:Lipase member I-like n=1 Tax=Asbolus verrucosus TaxID=1661398 RepID=A0A482V854_ASBVE|nr:lipase member I-like [Asbolus verrucosus]